MRLRDPALEVKLGTNTAHVHLVLEAYDRRSSVMPAYPVLAGRPWPLKDDIRQKREDVVDSINVDTSDLIPTHAEALQACRHALHHISSLEFQRAGDALWGPAEG